jgi:undecaprenyl-diphosphatase
MNVFQAVVYGLVQGATEWLPISSTAHLRIVPALLGWPDAGAAFTAVIQLGTLLAALVYFRKDIINILFTNRAADPESGAQSVADRRLLIPIIVGTLPVCVGGLAFKHLIEGPLRSLYVIAGSVIAFAIILAIVEKRYAAKRDIGSVSLMDGLLVGVGQMFALIPGASRSGTTITAALALGLDRATAARFSFLLSIPAVFLAGVYELYKKHDEIAALHMGPQIAIATAVSFVVGLASIDWLLKFLRSHSTFVFIGYRLILGILLIALLMTHRIAP